MSEHIERTFAMVKPDGVQRSLTGEIISRFEKVGLKIVGMKMVWVDEEFSKKHYKEHIDKPFYPGLEAMITEGPVVAMVLEGIHAVEQVRKMIGGTEPKSALPGTIRGDYAHVSYAHADSTGVAVKNLIHASGSKPEAKSEIELWFNGDELHTYKIVHEQHTL
ncbi:MAG: nucleoside-diphosphate kinase [Nanobdellota archaeon]